MNIGGTTGMCNLKHDSVSTRIRPIQYPRQLGLQQIGGVMSNLRFELVNSHCLHFELNNLLLQQIMEPSMLLTVSPSLFRLPKAGPD